MVLFADPFTSGQPTCGPNPTKLRVPVHCSFDTIFTTRLHGTSPTAVEYRLIATKTPKIPRPLCYPFVIELSNRSFYCTIIISINSCRFIHSFSSLSYDRSKASSKASSSHSAIQSFLFQMRVSSPFLKVIQ